MIAFFLFPFGLVNASGDIELVAANCQLNCIVSAKHQHNLFLHDLDDLGGQFFGEESDHNGEVDFCIEFFEGHGFQIVDFDAGVGRHIELGRAVILEIQE